jgi:NADH:ubiquinone oxidoreductase subunit 3 (subunit A)
MNTLSEFYPVLIFLLAATAFAVVPIVIACLIAPRTIGRKTRDTYECGMEPFGGAWIRYSAVYYIYALIFIAFDVDVLYLFPLAVSYTRGKNAYEFYTLLAFIALLAPAVIYAWGKGVFTWKRKIPS